MKTTVQIKSLFLRNTIVKNFSVLAFSKVLSQFLALFVSIKIARILTPSLFGTYNLLHVQCAVFAVIASFGLRNIIIRNIARNINELQAIFINSFILRGFGILVASLFFGLYYFIYTEYDTLLFLLVLVSIFARVFFDLFESVAFGLEKMEFSGVINISGTILFLFSLLTFPVQRLNLHTIFALFVLFYALKAVVYYFLLNKKYKLFKIDFKKIRIKETKYLFKISFPYYYLALLSLLSVQIPVFFLQFRSGVEQIAFFQIANKILIPINIIVSTILAAVYPNLSKLFYSNFNNFIRNAKMVFVLLTLFCVVAAFGISLFRNEVVLLLYSDKYLNSSLVISYQSWFAVLQGLTSLMGTMLSAINRQKILGYLSIISTVIQLPILWIGSKGGAQSLSAAFLIAIIIIFIIHFFVIRKFLNKKLSILFFTKILGILIVGYCAANLIPVGLNSVVKGGILGIVSLILGIFVFKKYKFFFLKLFPN